LSYDHKKYNQCFATALGTHYQDTAFLKVYLHYGDNRSNDSFTRESDFASFLKSKWHRAFGTNGRYWP